MRNRRAKKILFLFIFVEFLCWAWKKIDLKKKHVHVCASVFTISISPPSSSATMKNSHFSLIIISIFLSLQLIPYDPWTCCAYPHIHSHFSLVDFFNSTFFSGFFTLFLVLIVVVDDDDSFLYYCGWIWEKNACAEVLFS